MRIARCCPTRKLGADRNMGNNGHVNLKPSPIRTQEGAKIGSTVVTTFPESASLPTAALNAFTAAHHERAQAWPVPRCRAATIACDPVYDTVVL
jgi:hypothetical protein